MWETTRSSNMNKREIQRDTGTETGHLQKHDAGQRTAGDAAPLQQSAYDAAGTPYRRGRKNEQYCDGDGGKRIA